MRARRPVGSWWLLTGLLTAGCAEAAPLMLLSRYAQPDPPVVSPPGEDGTRYIAVHGGPVAAPANLRRRWVHVALQACGGEYQPLSDSGYSRRGGGKLRGRSHEGYVRCLQPDESEPGASPDAPTMADAETAPTSRRSPGRRRRRGRAGPRLSG